MSKSFRVRAGWPARQRGALAAACGLIGLALLPGAWAQKVPVIEKTLPNGMRVLLVTVMGGFAGCAILLPYWTWYGFPGDFTATSLLDIVLRALACGLRSIATWRWPSGFRSSMNRARPRSSGPSSRRGNPVPIGPTGTLTPDLSKS